jgi:hypothetical protein
MKIRQFSGIFSFAVVASVGSAQLISPLTGIDYSDFGISSEGGVVIDIVGSSGVQVISQIAAADLFFGYYNSFTNLIFGIPGAGPDSFIPDSTIGVRAGYDAGIMAALGGGIAQMAIRLTEFDGDTGSSGIGPGVNQYNPLLNGGAYVGIDLLVNGLKVGDFEDVGFESGMLDTGFFLVSDSALLASIFSSVESTSSIILGYDEGADKGTAFVDFKTGLDQVSLTSSLRPTVIPEPSVVGILGFGAIMGLISLRRRR